MDLTKMAGPHLAIYEAYYRQVDPKCSGIIEAGDAARFLKKSGLSDVVLSRIWDLSDPQGKGYLDKQGLYTALKLVSLAQAGETVNHKNIYADAKPPKVGEVPKISIKPIATATDWSMTAEERGNYEKAFQNLGPVNGLLPGAKVRNVLLESKLPVEILGKIWDLADQDRDGSLDKHEYIVAMHLVYKALQKHAIPVALPAQLSKEAILSSSQPAAPVQNDFDAFGGDGGFVANFPTDIAPPVVPPLPASIPPAIPPMSRVPPPTVPLIPLIPTDAAQPANSGVDWVVTPHDMKRYEVIFITSDKDHDGLVSGLEIKDVFIKSGLPQGTLAHIWALCDSNQSGKLKLEEFALAMWLVEQCKKGIPPPQNGLAPNMIPPSLRTKKDAVPQVESQPVYTNPELEMISKEIEELARERRQLEAEVAQKEADVRIKGGEVRSLQSELDTLTATLKQLENQKGEAQKRLDDLKAQVNKIREQCQKQEATLKEQETELDARKSELQKLKDEEQALEKEYDENLKEVEKLTQKLQDTQLQISQVKAMVTQIQEYQRQMEDALLQFKTAIETNDTILVSDYSLKIDPEFKEAKQALEDKTEMLAKDAFGDTQTNGFGDSNAGFQADFKTNGFATTFESTPGFDDAFGGTAFATAFDSKAMTTSSASSAFDDPFGEKSSVTPQQEPDKDAFGSDPFAILHAPTTASQILTPSPNKTNAPPRPESPSPALPPKKAKQPPPRPAPPRPLQGPKPTVAPTTTTADAFGDSSGAGGFANFADFDNKKIADFHDDPFKDYRYEDLSNIHDPFGDDGDTSASEDPFSSNPQIHKASEYHPMALSDKELYNRKIDVLQKASLNPKILDDSDADLFNSNSLVKSDRPRSSNTTDPFVFTANKSSTTTPNLDFFDAFNDNFVKNHTKTSNQDIFSAFGDDFSTTKISSKGNADAFDAFGDDSFSSLVDNFNKLDVKNNNTSDFAKFDAFESDNFFGSSNALQNRSNASPAPPLLPKASSSLERKGKLNSNNNNTPSPVQKFNEDYSKGECFEDDLAKVLQRSLMEK